MQVLISGNTSEQDAVSFCNEHLLGKLAKYMENAPASREEDCFQPVRLVSGMEKPVYWDCVMPAKGESEEEPKVAPEGVEDSHMEDLSEEVKLS